MGTERMVGSMRDWIVFIMRSDGADGAGIQISPRGIYHSPKGKAGYGMQVKPVGWVIV